MDNIKVFTAEHHDPWFNLATEDWLFNTFPENHQVLFLWRNKPCIVIGRFQNPWIECDLQAMERDKVVLARRQSGGGAVYHDLGNTNFTFMSPRAEYDKDRNFSIIIEALAKFGVEATQSGRNDIVVKERKVSGSAFRMTAVRAFHHGTLLINTDMSSLPGYLTPDKEKLRSKGIRSVASRVANLSEFNPEITHESLSEAIIETFFARYNTRCLIEDLTTERLLKEQSLYETYRRYADWNWRFGNTPRFAHPISARFDWGGITLDLDIQKGKIHAVSLYSDTLSVEFIEFLQSVLPGLPYTGKAIGETLEREAAPLSGEIRSMAADVAHLIAKECE